VSPPHQRTAKPGANAPFDSVSRRQRSIIIIALLEGLTDLGEDLIGRPLPSLLVDQLAE
jgi:hypothetical protein